MLDGVNNTIGGDIQSYLYIDDMYLMEIIMMEIIKYDE